MSDERKSRSQQKREAKALKALGEKLLTLSDEQLDHHSIPDELRVAVVEAKKIRSREAHRRQLQYIGRLMREVDPTEIREMIEEIEAGHRDEVGLFKRAETWRNLLIEGDDSVTTEICEMYPQVDRSQLNQLIRNARSFPEGEKGKKASRTLFRFLHDLVETNRLNGEES